MPRLSRLGPLLILLIAGTSLAQVLPQRRPSWRYLPVAGRIELPQGFQGDKWYIHPNTYIEAPLTLPQVLLPANVLKLNLNERTEWFSKWQQTPAGRALRFQNLRLESLRDLPGGLQVAQDGSFRWYNLPPDAYTMTVSFFGVTNGRPDSKIERGTQLYRFDIPGGARGDVIDLGVVPIQRYGSINAGQTAPNFIITSLDGQERLLSDLKGKVALLDFWGTWCGGCITDMPKLQKLHDRFKANANFELISIDINDSRDVLDQFLAKTKMPWTVVHGGGPNWAWSPQLYSVSGYPSYWLIGPDGKTIANGHDLEQMLPFVDKAVESTKK